MVRRGVEDVLDHPGQSVDALGVDGELIEQHDRLGQEDHPGRDPDQGQPDETDRRQE